MCTQRTISPFILLFPYTEQHTIHELAMCCSSWQCWTVRLCHFRDTFFWRHLTQQKHMSLQMHPCAPITDMACVALAVCRYAPSCQTSSPACPRSRHCHQTLHQKTKPRAGTHGCTSRRPATSWERMKCGSCCLTWSRLIMSSYLPSDNQLVGYSHSLKGVFAAVEASTCALQC